MKTTTTLRLGRFVGVSLAAGMIFSGCSVASTNIPASPNTPVALSPPAAVPSPTVAGSPTGTQTDSAALFSPVMVSPTQTEAFVRAGAEVVFVVEDPAGTVITGDPEAVLITQGEETNEMVSNPMVTLMEGVAATTVEVLSPGEPVRTVTIVVLPVN